MTTFLVIAAVIAELVLIALALVGLKTIRQQMRERDTGYRGHRNFGIPPRHDPWNTPSPAPVPQAAVPAPSAPTSFGSGRNSSPAFASPPRALPAPTTERKRHSLRLPSYIRLAVDNGPVPERRSRAGFKGNLRSVPR